MQTVELYGIPNCDQVRKARRWLNDAGVEYQFHDFKRTAPTEAQLDHWLSGVGADKLVNRRGTTWRNFDEKQRQALQNRDSLVAQLIATPTLIKRPVLVADQHLLVGFDVAQYAHIFAGDQS